MPDQNLNQARFKFAEDRVEQVFGTQSHLPPAVFAEQAFGWQAGRTYKHTSEKSNKHFPLPLVRVGSYLMVSAVDYFDFLFSGSTPSASPQKIKGKPGRKSNESKAQMNGGAHV